MEGYRLEAGTQIGGRYRIEKTLGEGGYGITYLGTDLRLDLPVAVKEYYPGFWVNRGSGCDVCCRREYEAAFQKGLQRFHEEALTLAQLHRIPEIVLVRDFFEEHGTGYLVMEYLDGQNLKQMTDGFGGRIPPEILMPVMDPIIRALQKVHSLGLIHRDISPDNIMMLENGSVKLLDFGNARDTTDDRSMTLAMKQGFAPPEQYRSKGQGTWTDVYGTCATIYYCLTGKLAVQALDRLNGKELPTLSQLGVTLPDYQERAILQGLDLFSKKRPQTMGELWKLLYDPSGNASAEEDATGIERRRDMEHGYSGYVSRYDGIHPSKIAEPYRGTELSRAERDRMQGDKKVHTVGADKDGTEENSHVTGYPDIPEPTSWFREACITIYRKLRGM